VYFTNKKYINKLINNNNNYYYAAKIAASFIGVLAAPHFI